jgi:hypothetical protein
MFFKDKQTVILMKKGQQYDTEEEKENKIIVFSKKFLLCELGHQGNWFRFMLTKVEMHALSNGLTK